MSTRDTQSTALDAETTPRAEPRDLRHFWRFLLAFVAPVGAAAIATGRFLMPYYTADDNATILDKVAAHLGTVNALLWLYVIGVLLLLPGVFAVVVVTRRSVPVLTAWAAILSILAYTAALASPNTDLLAYVAGNEGVDRAASLALMDGITSHPATGVLAGFFVIGHIVGTVLLGLALLRSRMAPSWMAYGLMVSQPLHLTAVLLSNRYVDLVGWGLTAVGFLGASLALLRMRDDEFDLPPARRAG